MRPPPGMPFCHRPAIKANAFRRISLCSRSSAFSFSSRFMLSSWFSPGRSPLMMTPRDRHSAHCHMWRFYMGFFMCLPHPDLFRQFQHIPFDSLAVLPHHVPHTALLLILPLGCAVFTTLRFFTFRGQNITSSLRSLRSPRILEIINLIHRQMQIRRVIPEWIAVDQGYYERGNASWKITRC